jgi:hypothetical protein
MTYKSIKTQEEMDELLNSINWDHCFIREIYTASPSYITKEKKATVNAETPPDFSLFLLTMDNTHPGVEFLFRRTKEIGMSFICDLSLKGIVEVSKGGGKSILFNLDSRNYIRADEVEYQLHGPEILGNRILFGWRSIDEFRD